MRTHPANEAPYRHREDHELKGSTVIRHRSNICGTALSWCDVALAHHIAPGASHAGEGDSTGAAQPRA